MTSVREATVTNGATPAPTERLTHQSLEALQSDDARQLMDTVDGLRKAGLGAIIQLPQIVTVGDQSSGKSSTLEAITGIPFPRKENLCTRFATQIVLRRASTESVSVAIIPDNLRPKDEQERLAGLHLTLEDFTKLDELMDQATEAMGLATSDAVADSDERQTLAFARDVLTIEISGPTRPHLTLVDLPGLIHSHNKQQSREDVHFIKQLVHEYMEEKRTIVLAVVSAKNDYANQIVLSAAHDLKADDRTLGIITKVDTLDPGSESERAWINLALNKDVLFGLGWHMLRNRAPSEMSSTLGERDAAEARHFSVGNYRELDRETLGIGALRQRLCKLLHRHLIDELPDLQEELDSKHAETLSQLQQLGAPRSTSKQQRQFLLQLGQKFERIADVAISGYYEGDFFNIDPEKPITDPANINRLRAVVQHANTRFAQQMRQYGAKLRITGSPSTSTADGDEDGPVVEDSAFPDSRSAQKEVTFQEALIWVRNVLERSRGRELAGNFNPLLIGQLFREQSQPWDKLAASHVDRIASYCAIFIARLLRSLTSEDVFKKIMTHLVEPALSRRKKVAHARLQEILEDKQGHPITYNHYYTSTVQAIRSKKIEKKLEKALEGLKVYDDQTTPVAELRTSVRTASIEQDMDIFSAEDALTCQMAFYKDELKYFINCVAKQVIERGLIKGLEEDIVSAVKFGEMDDKQISSLAKEADHVVYEREQLSRMLEMLEEGQEAFRKELGG
ncbi:dynamin family protein-like protein, partial [Myriangium duriaei CBS 260.36]